MTGIRQLYLNSDFRQVDFHCQLLAAVDVRVVGLFEGPLQLMKLIGGEGGPVSSVFLLSVLFLFDGLWRPFSRVQVTLQVAHVFVAFVSREKVRFWQGEKEKCTFVTAYQKSFHTLNNGGHVAQMISSSFPALNFSG